MTRLRAQPIRDVLDGGCMHCGSREHVFQFYTDRFSCRLCRVCLTDLFASLPTRFRPRSLRAEAALSVLENKVYELEKQHEQIRIILGAPGR